MDNVVVLNKNDIKVDQKNLVNKYNICIAQGWKVYNNIFIPILNLITGDNNYISFWSDEIAIKVSEQSYCIECGSETPTKRCILCQTTDEQKRFQCILTKAGEPFGERCTAENIPCGNLEYAKNICYSEYIVYIGKKGNSWKVGISRYNREGVDSGFILRIIEQGLEEVLLIRSTKKFFLPQAQEMEQKITEEIGIKQTITGKNELLNKDEIEKSVKRLSNEISVEKVQNMSKVGIFAPWLGEYEAKKLFEEIKQTKKLAGTILNGKILASWGKESIIKIPEGIIKINRDELLGKKLLPIQESIEWRNKE